MTALTQETGPWAPRNDWDSSGPLSRLFSHEQVHEKTIINTTVHAVVQTFGNIEDRRNNDETVELIIEAACIFSSKKKTDLKKIRMTQFDDSFS